MLHFPQSSRHWHLRSIDWLAALPEAAVARLRRQAVEVHFAEGQTVFAPDPAPEAVFILVTGIVRLYRLSSEGGEFTLAFVRPGEVFGELSVIDDHPRESFAQAVAPSTALRLPRQLFTELMQTVPQLGYSVTRQIARQTNRIETRVEDLVFRSLDARLAHVLLMLDEDFGVLRQGRRSIGLRLTQAELATLVGATRPAVNWAMMKLRKAGLIATENRHLVLPDPDALRRLAKAEETA